MHAGPVQSSRSKLSSEVFRTLRCTEHYRALAFAQLTGCESLRDIKACLAARSAKLYPSGASVTSKMISVGLIPVVLRVALSITIRKPRFDQAWLPARRRARIRCR